MDDIYENIEDYNPNRERKILIVFDDIFLICLVIKYLNQQQNNKIIHLINNESDIDKIYLYAKDPSEATCQVLINKRESTG